MAPNTPKTCQENLADWLVSLVLPSGDGTESDYNIALALANEWIKGDFNPKIWLDGANRIVNASVEALLDDRRRSEIKTLMFEFRNRRHMAQSQLSEPT